MVTLHPVEVSAEVVAIPVGSQSYYLEYRSKEGFSTDHLGHGLLVWKDFQIVQADGRDDLNNGNDLGTRPLPPIGENFGDASDPFPGKENVSVFEDTKAGVRLKNIKHFSDRIEVEIELLSNYIETSYLPPLDRFDGHERL
jgi:hypothetical protein